MIYLVLIVCLLVGCALAIVTLQNLTIDVQYTLFVWQTPHLPLGLLVVIAFLFGAFVLYIISVLSAIQDRLEVRRLQKKVGELEQAATRVPSDPLVRPPSGPLQSIGPSTTAPLPETSSPPQT